MADRNTLEQDIDEVLGAPAAAEAQPREIDREPIPDPVQAFEDLANFSEEPEEPEEATARTRTRSSFHSRHG